MKEKIYTSLSEFVDGYISEVHNFFGLQSAILRTQSLEITSRCYYSGREILDLVANFNQRTNQQCDELLDKVKNLCAESGRSLSDKQYNDLKSKCTKPFICGIDDFQKALQEEFEWTSTMETSLFALRQKVTSSINRRIDTFKTISSVRLDKTLRWTILGTVISTLLSVLTIIISIVKS